MRRIKKYNLFIYIAVICIIRVVLVCNLPIIVITAADIDDLLMVKMSSSLLRLDWLGDYNNLTLVKGISFPLFLAVSKVLSIPYLTSVTLFYLIGCFVFVYALKDVLKSKLIKAVMFTVLAFNPIMFSDSVFQRVYRCSLIPGQVLILIGCLFAVYLKREQPIKKLLPWLIFGGLDLAFFWHTREDSLYMLPFVLGCLGITAGILIKRYFMTKNKRYILKSSLCALPLVILLCSSLLISTINYAKYNVFTTNELNSSNFTKAMKSILSVKPDETIDFVSTPQSTLEKLYTVSPSLNSIKDQLETELQSWDGVGMVANDGQVDDGWFFWYIRYAVADAGYYENAATADAFYKTVHEEIEQAFDEGKLEKRALMPSAFMSPWREGYGEKLLSNTKYCIGFVAAYSGIHPSMFISDGSDPALCNFFEYVTGNYGIYTPNDDRMLTFGFSNKLMKIDQFIVTAYQKTGIPFLVLGILSYLLFTVLMILYVRKKEFKYFDIWLMLTSLFLVLFLLILGISYSNATAFYAIDPLYLSAAYPLLILFIFLGLLCAVQFGADKMRERRSKSQKQQPQTPDLTASENPAE